MKCSNPNIIRLETDGEGKRHVVGFFPAGRREFTQQWYDTYVKAGSIEVPCGKCVACRLEYSRIWANRVYLESLCHPCNWFITLTYDDDHLVYGEKGFATLEKDAISSFIKNLRNKFRDAKIRYFGCGEYGDQTMRPHHHIIVFGAPLSDLISDMPDMSKPMINGRYPIFRRKNSNGDYVYFSQTIFDCWKKGKVEVEDASWNCGAYVSRYVMKKQKGLGSEIYKRLGILPEYLRMSTKPGIGATWLLEHKNKLLENDYLSVKNAKGVQTSRPPRYFEKLMFKDEDSLEACLMDINKTNRIINSMRKCKDYSSTITVGQKAKLDAEFIEKKSKLLKREIT